MTKCQGHKGRRFLGRGLAGKTCSRQSNSWPIITSLYPYFDSKVTIKTFTDRGRGLSWKSDEIAQTCSEITKPKVTHKGKKEKRINHRPKQGNSFTFSSARKGETCVKNSVRHKADCWRKVRARGPKP